MDEDEIDEFLSGGDDQEEEEQQEQEKPVTYTAADLERIRAEEREAIRAEEEAKFNERRSYFDRRENDRQKALRERGLMIAEDGSVGVMDPTRVLGSLLGVQPQQQVAGDDDPEPEIDVYDPSTIKAHNRWSARQERKAIEESIRAEYAPVIAAQSTLIRPRAYEAAKSFLAENGLDGLEERQEFQQAFNYAFGQLDAASQANPQQAMEAASWAMARVPAEVRAEIRKDAAQRRADAEAQAERDRQREAAAQTTAANGIRSFTAGQPSQISQSEENTRQNSRILEALGDIPEARQMLKLVDAPPLKNGQNALEMFNAKKRAGARR